MNKFLVGSLFVVLLVLSACATPAPASAPAQVTTSDSATTVKSETIPVEGEPVVEASEVETNTLLIAEVPAVPIVLVSVEPKSPAYPTLGQNQIMPGWALGDGTMVVPQSYECIVTTDPYTLYDLLTGATLSSGKSAVLLLGPGAYRVVTLLSPSGSVNAYPECSNMLSPVTIEQRRQAQSDNVSYVVDVVDHRTGAVVALATVATTVVTATAATTSTVIETIPVEVPADTAVEVTEEVPVVTCVPDDTSFLVGYDNPQADMVVVNSDLWVLAGMDPARVNQVQYGDRVLLLVQPGQNVQIEGLGYSSEGTAHMYACAFESRPSVETLAEWKTRESDNGSRTVSEVFIED